MSVPTLLSIRDLDVRYGTERGPAQVLRGIDVDIPENSVVGIVGESGSGKSTLALALMNLLPPNATQAAASFLFEGEDLARQSAARRRRLRGTKMAMVFQDPMSSLHPLFAIGTQLVDIQRARYPALGRPRGIGSRDGTTRRSPKPSGRNGRPFVPHLPSPACWAWRMRDGRAIRGTCRRITPFSPSAM
jgi:ABC-type oligopeptide transport system ATPase subunit